MILMIYSYTRAQVMADGILIEVNEMTQEAVIWFPTAVTDSFYQRYIIPQKDAESFGQSTDGRLWDVLLIFRSTALNCKESRMTLCIEFMQGLFGSIAPAYKAVEILVMVHPVDNGEPVITIMLPGYE